MDIFTQFDGTKRCGLFQDIENPVLGKISGPSGGPLKSSLQNSGIDSMKQRLMLQYGQWSMDEIIEHGNERSINSSKKLIAYAQPN